MTGSVTDDDAGGRAGTPYRFDSATPTPARMWNYWVGGKDHFAVDRDAAAKIQAAMPTLQLPAIARATRAFLIETVHHLTADCGIRQFLDIGGGLPTAENTHEVAQRAAPESRIVYADYDPSVPGHARALLSSTPEGKADYIHADLRDTATILAGAARTLDFSEPVAILLIAVLHFIPDSDDPYGVVRRLITAVPAGSFLAIVHAPKDINAQEVANMTRRYNESGAQRMHPRTQQEIRRFFDGMELTGPGVSPLTAWLSPAPADPADERARAGILGAVGRKPR